MPRSTKKSTYFFIGSLSDYSAKYNVQEFPLANGFVLEVLYDGISIWGDTDENFGDILPKIKETFNIIVAAFVFKTKKPLRYTLKNWIETKEVIARKNMIGWFLNPFASRKHYPKKSKYNTAWKKAGWLYNNLSRGNNNHSLALKDYHSAITDTSDDALLFAYRSIEDICRSVTGCDEIKRQAWQKMHRILGTSNTLIKPLNEIAKKIRHGDKNHKIVIQARPKRDELINIAHTVIEKEMRRTFPRFIK